MIIVYLEASVFIRSFIHSYQIYFYKHHYTRACTNSLSLYPHTTNFVTLSFWLNFFISPYLLLELFAVYAYFLFLSQPRCLTIGPSIPLSASLIDCMLVSLSACLPVSVFIVDIFPKSFYSRRKHEKILAIYN